MLDFGIPRSESEEDLLTDRPTDWQIKGEKDKERQKENQSVADGLPYLSISL